MNKSICIVTEEWPGIPGCGGIGTAFFEQCKLLSQNFWRVDVLLIPCERQSAKEATQIAGVELHEISLGDYVYAPHSYDKRSYAVAQWLRERDGAFASIQFCDYKGLGFFAVQLKRQGLAFLATELTVQLHGFTRWATELNGAFFSHEDQLLIDFLEKESARNADSIVSPSNYLIDWARQNQYLGARQDVRCIPNCHITLAGRTHQIEKPKKGSRYTVDELIFVGRHEERKALDVFIEAVLLNEKDLAAAGVQITIIGGFGKINGTPSGLYLMNKLGPSSLKIALHADFNRHAVIDYLCSRSAPLVVVPSPAENSPYTVLEPLVIGIPVITSNRGGAKELIAKASSKEATFEPSKQALADKLKDILQKGCLLAQPSDAVLQAHGDWLSFLEEIDQRLTRVDAKAAGRGAALPLITVGITHYERPDKLLDAVTSILLQDYQNLELIVVDDGSKKPATLEKLTHIERVLARIGGRLVVQKNSYLGAARNRLIAEARGEYIVFLDDDNTALPEMVSTLCAAITNSGAEIVTAQSIFMPVDKRIALIAARGSGEPVSYVPAGGPISLAPIRNVFGDASGIYKLDYLKKLGGYTELANVGHEDYELLARAVFAGARLVHCPIPVYLYEVGRPSMLTNNSMEKDYQRVYRVIAENFSSFSRDFEDFCQISVGKHVYENSYNREHWKLSLMEERDLLLPLLNPQTSREDYLGNLLKLAVMRGYSGFAGAIYGILSSPPSVELPVRPSKRAGPRGSNENGAQLFALYSAEGEDFVARFCKLAEESVVMTEQMLALANNWLMRSLSSGQGGKAISMEFFELIFEELDTNEPQAEGARQLLVNMLTLLGSSAHLPVFVPALRRVFSREAVEYIGKYQDMRDLYAARPLQSYLHFAKHGKTEGRLGFVLIERFLKQLAASSASNAIRAVVREILLDKSTPPPI